MRDKELLALPITSSRCEVLESPVLQLFWFLILHPKLLLHSRKSPTKTMLPDYLISCLCVDVEIYPPVNATITFPAKTSLSYLLPLYPRHKNTRKKSVNLLKILWKGDLKSQSTSPDLQPQTFPSWVIEESPFIKNQLILHHAI